MSTDELEALRLENLRLQRAVEELSVLNELARAIGAARDSEAIMQTIVERSLQATQAEQGVITLVNRGADRPLQTLVRAMGSETGGRPFHLTEALLGWMYLEKRPLAVADPAAEPRFRGVEWDPGVRSLLCVPLVVRGELTGILTLYNKKGGAGFGDEDKRLSAIIAAQSAQVVETARLHEKERDLLRMQEQVRLAGLIQEELLPKRPPAVPGYELAGATAAAQVVGGDYFDFLPLGEGRWALCVADVSGKGLPASLLMANVQATIRACTRAETAAAACMGEANRLLAQSTRPEKFVTLFYAVLDPGRRQLTFCNAGHNPPLLLSAGGERARLTRGGPALGVLPAAGYGEETVGLGPGDLLVVYSDGITEALDEGEEEYGEERLAAFVAARRGEPAAALVAAILADVRRHAGRAPQRDDMTLVAVRGLPP